MKRFALYSLPFIVLAACDSPSAPVSPTTSIQQVTVDRASAQLQNERFYLSGITYNSCPPQEYVQIEGWYHYVVTGEETPEGSDIKVHFNAQGLQGVGLTSGDRYQFIQNYKSDYSFSNLPPYESEQEWDIRYRLIRQGSEDNLWLRQTYRYSYPPGEFEIIRNEFECRG